MLHCRKKGGENGREGEGRGDLNEQTPKRGSAEMATLQVEKHICPGLPSIVSVLNTVGQNQF